VLIKFYAKRDLILARLSNCGEWNFLLHQSQYSRVNFEIG
jgi:hypothetical protein